MTKQKPPAIIPDAIAAQPKPVLTFEEVNAIADIVATAPCPNGIPQAQARANLIAKFVASTR